MHMTSTYMCPGFQHKDTREHVLIKGMQMYFDASP
jgi:hypothetical protein